MENQIAINEKLTAEGLYLDDKVKVKGDDTTYKVVGILKTRCILIVTLL